WAAAYERRAPDQRPLRSPFYGLRELEELAWAQVRLAEGEDEPVRARLEARVDALGRLEEEGRATEFRVLLAMMYQRQGRRVRAVAVLQPALARAAQEDIARLFLDAGRPLLPLLQECAAQGIEPDYVASLLNGFRVEGVLREPRRDEVS